MTRRYGRRIAVDALDITVYEGDIYGFLGPNGAGKTTAMRCMLGLISRHAGRVSFFGDDHGVRARSQIGAIVETPAFHGWMSGRDNLWLSGIYAGLSTVELPKEIDRVLERVGLSERARDRASGYSLGMRQRLAIARALLGRPRLLLLDEPTNGLDPAGMRELRELIRSLALHDQITIFISSHLLTEIQAICNRVSIIQEGRLRAEGLVADLLSGQATPWTIVEVGAVVTEGLEALVERLEGASFEGAGAEGRVRIKLQPELPVPALVQALVSAGVEIEAVVPERRNLEDVFMEVTR